jgi:hypothetical protein
MASLPKPRSWCLVSRGKPRMEATARKRGLSAAHPAIAPIVFCEQFRSVAGYGLPRSSWSQARVSRRSLPPERSGWSFGEAQPRHALRLTTTAPPDMVRTTMIGRPRKVFGRVRVCCSVALLLIPLALSGHFHDLTSHESASSRCALCVVAQHIPAAKSSVQPCLAPILQRIAVSARRIAPPAPVCPPFRAGRAPPPGSPLA